ncbi:ridA [Mytilus coruscus]|uniref:RidA n=1 Tax=Mytilus coruscus TaxID=42192 RepID=A0A6J8ACF4_MYTCO|nr:ridA [Mytilus coruscus]
MRSVLAVLILACTVQANNHYQSRKSKTPWWRHKPPCIPVTKRIIETDKAPIFNLPFSQAVLAGNTLYLSGQLGIDPVTLKLVPGGIIPETEQIFKNVGAVLEAAGGSMKDVVKVTAFLTDLTEYSSFNAVYMKFFPKKFPARSSCQVVAISQGAQLEIDVIAVIDKC